MESQLNELALEAGGYLEAAGSEVYDLVETSRTYENHRKALYMVGAPVAVYTGMKQGGLLGLATALFGAYVGVKNYQDEKADEAVYGNCGVCQHSR
jgi:hypothetical protein